MHLALYNDLPSSAPIAARFTQDNLLARLEAIDSKARRKGLDSLDPSRNLLIDIGMESKDGQVTKNSYGLFHLPWLAKSQGDWPARIAAELEEIRTGIRTTHGVPLRFLIWAGMGGSAEDKSMYVAAGLTRRNPQVFVLDSTDPAKLKAILAAITARAGSLPAALKSTLVVGMAMGMTSYEPVVNLEKLTALYDRHRIDSRPNFLYMTLPGSILDQFAGPRGYRSVPLQPDNGNSTAGRHSAPLTRGSLYPLGLAGVDLEEWIIGSFLSESSIQAAFELSSFLQAQAVAGRDKVTLVLCKSLASAALWTKQNFEESLGKSEQIGIKIVINEKLRLADYRSPKDPVQDRLFLFIQRKGEAFPEREKLALLRRSGYPAAHVTVDSAAPLSGYLQFVHYAVFGLGWLRKMNFVTQPSVELYKAITAPLFAEAQKAGSIEETAAWKEWRTTARQYKWRGGITLRCDRIPAGVGIAGPDAASAYASLLTHYARSRAIEYGELTFFGDTRYAPHGIALRRALDSAAQRIFRTQLHMPADVYEGPAMNHSYHEMIIGHGKCFSTILCSEKQERLDAAGYRADYHLAQFLATQTALAQRNRPVVSVTLKDLEPATVKAFEEFTRQIVARLKTRK